MGVMKWKEWGFCSNCNVMMEERETETGTETEMRSDQIMDAISTIMHAARACTLYALDPPLFLLGGCGLCTILRGVVMHAMSLCCPGIRCLYYT